MIKSIVVGGLTAAAVYAVLKLLKGDKEAEIIHVPVHDVDEEHERLEASHRAKGAKVPETPLDMDAYKNKTKQSLGYVSSVANALKEVERDFDATPMMDMAVEEACTGVVMGEGGPFGAVICMKVKNKNGTYEEQVIARAHNMVLQSNDPTAHAEVTVIRKAAARLGRFDLKDCVLYSSCYPCPMCYGAIHWAKIPVCYYAATADDAADAGFDDRFILESIQEVAEETHCDFVQLKHKGAIKVFKQSYQLY